jgi:superfamily I DNA/RNA helicase
MIGKVFIDLRSDIEQRDHKRTTFIYNITPGKCGFFSDITDDKVPNHLNQTKEPFKYSEERRLFYVGMTRAERNLFLLRPKKVMMNGFYHDGRPSRFISEIDKNYLYKN